MDTETHHLPVDLMQSMTEANVTQHGKCFENRMIAVLGLRKSCKLQYVLGFMTPPGYGPVVHAWLAQETQSGVIYLDSTLQASFPLWSARKDEFTYDERHKFTKEQLLKWLQDNYADREFTDPGIPEGAIKGPRLNASGELE